jgi:hypothetical protein
LVFHHSLSTALIILPWSAKVKLFFPSHPALRKHYRRFARRVLNKINMYSNPAYIGRYVNASVSNRISKKERPICMILCRFKQTVVPPNQGCQMVYIFTYQKSEFWYILDGLGTENCGIGILKTIWYFKDHFVYFTYIWSICIFYGHFVYVMVILYTLWSYCIFFRFGTLYQYISGNPAPNVS